MEELFAQENWGDDFDWNDLLFPFVRYCLSHLKEEGYTCMIASSSPTDVIQRMVTQTGIGQYLDAIYSGQDCQNGKPDPEIYLKIMEDYRIRPKDMIIVEDSPHGIQAGKAAGCTVIARQEDRLPICQDQADVLAADFVEIYEAICQWNREEKTHA